jgi:hypothetical protein
MKQTLFSTTTYPVTKLIQDIDLGEIALPDIQRPFVWKGSKVRDLFDSLYKGFPVGYLLFWSYSPGANTKQIGTSDKSNAARLLVVDGQQRLTSLYAVMKGKAVLDEDFNETKIKISFRPADANFEVQSAATRRDPEYISNISSVWSDETDLFDFVGTFVSRLKDKREVSGEEKKTIQNAIQRLYSLQQYNFTALELNESVNEEEVAEVFVRINSKGKSLNQADFILTLMSVFWDDGRRDLETFCYRARKPTKGAASPFNHFVEPDPDQLLRASIGLGFRRARLQYAYSILSGKDLETGEVSDDLRLENFQTLQEAQDYALDLTHWHEYFNALSRAGFRSGDMITSQMTIFYCYLMYLIGRRDFGLKGHELRTVMARWFFMCNISRRYTGSSESTMEADLSRINNAETDAEFVRTLDQIIENTLTNDFWTITLPAELESSTAYSPTLFAYHAALNIMDAKALFSDLKLTKLLDPSVNAKKNGVERHHLFPKSYLKKQGVTSRTRRNQIANYAHVEWADNIQIADRSPADYFPEYAERFDNDELEQMMEWHALPEGWETMPYEEFLEARRDRIAAITRKGFERLTEKADHVLSSLQ